MNHEIYVYLYIEKHTFILCPKKVIENEIQTRVYIQVQTNTLPVNNASKHEICGSNHRKNIPLKHLTLMTPTLMVMVMMMIMAASSMKDSKIERTRPMAKTITNCDDVLILLYLRLTLALNGIKRDDVKSRCCSVCRFADAAPRDSATHQQCHQLFESPLARTIKLWYKCGTHAFKVPCVSKRNTYDGTDTLRYTFTLSPPYWICYLVCMYICLYICKCYSFCGYK